MSNQVQIPELDGTSLARYLWRQLTSMRTALILLLLLGVAAIPGSLFPQRTQNPMQVSLITLKIHLSRQSGWIDSGSLMFTAHLGLVLSIFSYSSHSLVVYCQEQLNI